MGMFTVATPSPMILGVPRPWLIAIAFTLYMFVSLRAKIGMTYRQFVLAYLAAFVPATLYNMSAVSIKWTSVLQLLPMLVTFCVLGTYFERWLNRVPDDVKTRWIEGILIYFFVMSVLELMFYQQFATLRAQIFPNLMAESFGAMGSQARELEVYGGRPTALFSEPSNLAKFISLIVAAYMTVTKCSKRSIAALVVLYLLIRSVSYFYAAPVMALAWWRSSFYRSSTGRRGRINPVKVLAAGLIGVCLLVGVLVTQSKRIGDAASGQDTSMSGRIGLPIQFALAHADTLITGRGITPQDELANFTILANAMTRGSMDEFSGILAATSTTIVVLTGIGVVGLVVFYVALYLMRRGEGVWIATVFLVSNIINAGYNGATTFVLSALLVGLLIYELRLARAQRAQPVPVSSLQLEPLAR
jgi:hypothetical protein